jgi:serine/threonine protein kinase
MTQIWDVMEDLTKGVAFIHSQGHVHRDLKPRNSISSYFLPKKLTLVLYSASDQAWKIADFGLTSEGTSKRAHTTRYAQGTPSYRSPELIEDFKYTNKVDIWAVGCILYELIFKKKAFSGDGTVLRYFDNFRATGTLIDLPFENDTIPDEARRTFLTSIILEMLDVDDTRRPGAWNLYEKFITWGAPIRLPSGTLTTLATTKATATEAAGPETPAIVELAAPAIEPSEPPPDTIHVQFPFRPSEMSPTGFDQGLQIQGEERDLPKQAAKEPTEDAVINEHTDPPATPKPYTHPHPFPPAIVPSLEEVQQEPAPTPAIGFSAFTETPKPRSRYDLQSRLNPTGIYLFKLSCV